MRTLPGDSKLKMNPAARISTQAKLKLKRSLTLDSGGGNFIFDDILPEELARVTRAADRAAELGAPHLVVGGGAKRFDGIRESDYHKLAAALDRVKDLAEARELGADPAELRRRNFVKSFPHATPVIMTYDAGDYDASMTKAMEDVLSIDIPNLVKQFDNPFPQ